MLARAGVPSAVDAVVDRLRPRLTKMAWFYARHARDEADDLLQEAWIGLLEALRELDVTIGDPEQYLILRAKWRLLDRIKRSHAAGSRETGGDALSGDQEETPDGMAVCPMDHVLAALCLAEFESRLKPRQRLILRCLMRGLTWRETGSALGCTSANVAYHVRQIAHAYEAWNSEASIRTF